MTLIQNRTMALNSDPSTLFTPWLYDLRKHTLYDNSDTYAMLYDPEISIVTS